MDAKTRANFINSVAGGQKIPCPKCNTLNDADSRFCMTCGTPIAQTKAPAVEPPLAPSPRKSDPPAPKPVSSASVSTSKMDEAAEESNIFAKGLPGWDIVPPHVVIRRKKR